MTFIFYFWGKNALEFQSAVNQVTKFLKESFQSRRYLTLFIFILLIRGVFILIPPLVTSDLLRNIFYGTNFWKHGFAVYNMTPLDLDPNYAIVDPLSGALSWEKNMYDYPMFHLLFFAFITLLPLPVLITKTVFTVIDVVNFFIIRSYKQFDQFSWLYLIVSAFFSSLEGQVTPITVFIFLFGIYLYNSEVLLYKRCSYLIAAIGFHWKIIGVILFPYFFLKDLINSNNAKFSKNEQKELIVRFLYFLIPFTIFMIIPLLNSLYLFNSQFATGFLYDIEPWNPLYLPILYPSGILLALATLTICLLWINLKSRWQEGVEYTLLLELGIFFLFIYKFAMPWSWLYFVPAFLVIPNQDYLKRNRLILLYFVIFLLASVDFFQITIGFDRLSDLVSHFINRLF